MSLLTFDEQFYLANNQDVAQAVDAGALASGEEHYLAFGALEGRDPNRLFDSDFYLESNPDVAAAGVNPLQHYLSFGQFEGRQPSPSYSFDGDFYLASNPDVAAAIDEPNPHLISAFQHFAEFGADEGRAPSEETPGSLAFVAVSDPRDADGGSGEADTLILSGRPGASVTFDLAADDQTPLAGDQENFEGIDLSGILGDDGHRVLGDDAANAITGSGGDDTLVGGRGSDAISGGQGDDVFVLAQGDSSSASAAGASILWDQYSNVDADDDLFLIGNLVESDAFSSTDIDAAAAGLAGASLEDAFSALEALVAAGGDLELDANGVAVFTTTGFDNDLLNATYVFIDEDGVDGWTPLGDTVLQILSIDGTLTEDNFIASLADGIDTDVTLAVTEPASADGGFGDDGTLALTGDPGASVTFDLASADQTPLPGIQEGFENLDLSDIAGGDGHTVLGSDAANAITGTSGDDTLAGGAGADAIAGGDGDDVFVLNQGDTTSESAAAAGITWDQYTGVDAADDLFLIGNSVLDIHFSSADIDAEAAGLADASLEDAFATLEDLVAAGGDRELNAQGVAVFTATGFDTDLLNATYVFIDEDGVDGWTAETDSVLQILSIDGALTADNFIASVAGGLDTDVTLSVSEPSGASGGFGTGGTLTLTGDPGESTSIALALADQTALPGVQEGFESVDLSGITGNDGHSVFGSSAANVITGSSGDDTLIGDVGADIIEGGDGADVFVLSQFDTTSESAAAGGITWDQYRGVEASADRFQIGNEVDADDFSSTAVDAEAAGLADASLEDAFATLESLVVAGGDLELDADGVAVFTTTGFDLDLLNATYAFIDEDGVDGWTAGTDSVLQILSIDGTLTADSFF